MKALVIAVVDAVVAVVDEVVVGFVTIFWEVVVGSVGFVTTFGGRLVCGESKSAGQKNNIACIHAISNCVFDDKSENDCAVCFSD